MRKLLAKLNKWYLKQNEPSTTLSKWQRDYLFDFLTEHIKEVTKNNDR